MGEGSLPEHFSFTFIDTQYTDCFTAVRRGADITHNGALDLGGTGHTALNFTPGRRPRRGRGKGLALIL